MKNYRRLAQLLGAISNCNKVLDQCVVEIEHCTKCTNAQEWAARHQINIDCIMTNAPSGSGFDSGTTLEQLERSCSTAERLVFITAYHHLNENGFYIGWSHHTVVVTPSLQFGYKLKVTGTDKTQIKEYIADCFSAFLDQESVV